MIAFRTFLAVLFVGVCGYTVVVVGDHGLGLFPVFFGDIAQLGWPGQFNVDFLGFLLLSGFWLAWRHHFSPGGLLLGVLGVLGGIPLLTAYLFVVSIRGNGDVAALLMGETRAERLRDA